MLASLRSTAVAPRRPALPSLGDSERDRRSRSQPRPRCPGSAASRSTFLPTSWSAPREPAPESSLLGRSRPRASARRPSRRSMCGRACTPRTRAAARALTGTGSRLAAWSARPFKFLLRHSAAAKRAHHSADWRRSWSEGVATEAQLATGASSATWPHLGVSWPSLGQPPLGHTSDFGLNRRSTSAAPPWGKSRFPEIF